MKFDTAVNIMQFKLGMKIILKDNIFVLDCQTFIYGEKSSGPQATYGTLFSFK